MQLAQPVESTPSIPLTCEPERRLGPSIEIVERDGLRVLKISRASWRHSMVYELVLGPPRLEA